MKRLPEFFIFVFLIKFGLCFSASADNKTSTELTPEMKRTNAFVTKAGQEIEKKYGMTICSTDGQYDKGIWKMLIGFQHYGEPLDEKQARKLLVNCIHDFLEVINKDEEIRPFLEIYPFAPKNIKFEITFFTSSDRKKVFYPYITSVFENEGKVEYTTEDALNRYRYKTKYRESFTESETIVQNEKERDIKAG